VDIEEVDPGDHETHAAVARLLAEAASVDCPWVVPPSAQEVAELHQHGTDGDAEHLLVGRDRGTVVARGSVAAGSWDNLDGAWTKVAVHPLGRGEGRGSAMADAVAELAGSLGRHRLGASAWARSPGTRFAERRGFTHVSTTVQRRQHLPDLEPRQIDELHDGAGAIASAYELVRFAGRTPEESLEELAHVAASVNDAPHGTSERELDSYDPRRVRAFEETAETRGQRLYRLVARHRDSGRLAAHTTMVVDPARPSAAVQDDTTVMPAHRGHRLGLWLKSGMLLWLREVEPQVISVDTWNEESNQFMVAINDMLGYRVLGSELAYER